MNLFVMLIAAAFPAELATPMPPPEPARTLLVAPVQAAWAAERGEHWQRLGFDGLVLSGICTHFADNPFGHDGRPHRMGHDDLLVQEIRGACWQLAEYGVTENFVQFPMQPEAPWFAGGVAGRALLRGLADAAAFAKAAGLRGVAIETGSSGLVHHPAWDGYDPAIRGTGALTEGAHALGRRAMRKLAATYPDLDLLLLADALPEAGPLWFHFVSGLVDGLGAADTIGVHVLVRESVYETRPGALRAIVRQSDRAIAQRLPPASQRRWQQFGSVGLGMRPLGHDNAGSPVRHYPLPDFRVQALAAQTFSGRYCWVEAPEQAWWRVAEEDADWCARRLQLGARAATQTRPIAADLNAYTLNTAARDLARVGPLDTGHGTVDVFRGVEGAAVLFWGGRHTLAPAARGARQTRVRTGSTAPLEPDERDGWTADAREGPVLVAPLPDADWSLPAALWLTVEAPLTPLQRRARVAFGFRNPLDYRVEGTLQVLTPPAFSVGVGTMPLSAGPDESVFFTRTLQGVFATGPGYPFTLTLALPEAESDARVAARTVPVPVLPPLVWEAFLDAPPLGPPLHLVIEDDDSLLVVTTPEEVAAFDTGGALQWRHRPARACVAPAVATRGRLDEALVAVLTAGGTVVLLTPEGALRQRVDTGLELRPGFLTSVALHDGPGETLLAADRGLRALTPHGAVLWHQPETAPLRHMRADTHGAGPARVFAAPLRPKLYALDRDGDIVWEADTVGPVSAPLQLTHGPGTGTVTVATVHGRIMSFDTATGEETGRFVLPEEAPVRALATLAVAGENGARHIAATAATVFACTEDGDVVWETRVPACTGLDLTYFAGAPAILAAAADGLHAFCLDGALLWKDERAAAPVSGVCPLDAAPGTGLVTAVYTAGDRAVRGVDLGPARHPRTRTLPTPEALLPEANTLALPPTLELPEMTEAPEPAPEP